MEIALQAAGLEGAVGRGIQLRVLAAVADVDLVDVVHQLHGLLLADILVQRAAFAVRGCRIGLCGGCLLVLRL